MAFELADISLAQAVLVAATAFGAAVIGGKARGVDQRPRAGVAEDEQFHLALKGRAEPTMEFTLHQRASDLQQ